MSGGNPYLNAGRAAGGLPSGNPYLDAGRSTPAPAAVAAPPKSGSLLGNLLHDTSSAVTGFVPGGVATAEHPIRTAQQIGHSEYQSWRPFVAGYKDLATGDVAGYQRNKAEFDQAFHAHPLGPILDLAALVTGGGARAAALGTLPRDASLADVARAGVRGQYAGPLRTITVKAAQGGGDVAVRTLPRNAARAARMQATDRLLKVLPPDTRMVGEYARAARALKSETLPTELALRATDVSTNYLKAFSRLDARERVAVRIHNMLPLREDLARWRASLPAGDKAAQQLGRTLDDPKVLRLYETFQEHPRLVAAAEAERALSGLTTELKVRRGDLTAEVAAAAPYRHMRLARGASFVAETPARLGKPTKSLKIAQARVASLEGRIAGRPRSISQAQTRLTQLEKEHLKAVDQVAAGMFGPAHESEVRFRTGQNKKAALQESGLTATAKASGASGYKATKRPTVVAERRALAEQAVQDAIAQNPDHPTLARWQQRLAEIDQLHASLYPEFGEKIPRTAAALGRAGVSDPQRRAMLEGALAVAREDLARSTAGAARRVEPTGLVGGGTPDELRAELQAAGKPQPYHVPDAMIHPTLFQRVTRGSGLTPPAANVHQSTGFLFTHGLLALHPDLLGPQFLREAVRERSLELHDRIVQVARPSQDGNLLHGYRWVRTKRGESIPFTATAHGEHIHETDRALGQLHEPLTVTGTEQERTGEQVATDAQGRKLMVPERFAQTLEADLARGSNAALKVINAPLQVWRALILNLRVPWLENNILGNGVLTALRFAGPDGLRATLGMIRETKGAQAARRALGWAESNGHLAAADVNELLPEISKSGTFIGTQLPPSILTRAPGAVQKIAKGPGKVVGFLPSIDRATEGALRRAAAETVLRGSPEVKALYKAMPAQTRSWRAAMRKGLENPDLRRLVVREVNDALGNFLSLNRVERDAIRQVIPFYAWFREIARITAKLPLDHPARADLAVKVGQVGSQEGAGLPLPSYLKGSVAVGAPQGDLQRILALRSANPYTSAVDVARSVGSFLPGGNAANADALTGELSPFIQGPLTYIENLSGYHPSKLGLLGETAKSTFLGLPETRIGTNPPSRMYPTRTRRDLLEQFLGDPRRTISKQQAAYYAAQGK